MAPPFFCGCAKAVVCMVKIYIFIKKYSPERIIYKINY